MLRIITSEIHPLCNNYFVEQNLFFYLGNTPHLLNYWLILIIGIASVHYRKPRKSISGSQDTIQKIPPHLCPLPQGERKG